MIEDRDKLISQLLKERDDYLHDAKMQCDAKSHIKKISDASIDNFRQKNHILEERLFKITDEASKSHSTSQNYEKMNKVLIMEKEKMKKRIAKLVAKKGSVASDCKQCKNCSKEYIEKENFNWSCRTHQSDWGGEMWWCCGKHQRDQPGCKFSKHESKDEDDVGEAGGTNDPVALAAAMKYVRCLCCRQLGHKIEHCFRDPNLRTVERNVDAEFERIRKLKDFRKLHSDTLVNTTHMIKKAVMVPIGVDDEGMPVENEERAATPFCRGVLNFDDYNYKAYNQYVMIPGPGEASEKETNIPVQFDKASQGASVNNSSPD